MTNFSISSADRDLCLENVGALRVHGLLSQPEVKLAAALSFIVSLCVIQ